MYYEKYLLSHTNYATDVFIMLNSLMTKPLILLLRYMLSSLLHMEFPLMILPSIANLLVVWFISLSLGWQLAYIVHSVCALGWIASYLKICSWDHVPVFICLFYIGLNSSANTDADWARDISERKSTSGFCVFMITLLQRLNIVLWPMRPPNWFGSASFYRIWIWVSLSLSSLCLFIVIIWALFRLFIIRFSMKAQTMLK